MDNFKPGDLVRLKSGGPAMTVEQFYSATAVSCVWFDDKNAVARQDFPAAVLIPYEPPKLDVDF